VRKSQIQGFFKGIQGHVSANSRLQKGFSPSEISVKSDIELFKTQLQLISNIFVRYEHAKSVEQNVCF
jgi:hypothetical protein